MFPECFFRRKDDNSLLFDSFKLFALHLILTFGGSISGHPWILFYTAHSLTMLPIKTKLRHQIGATRGQLAAAPEPRLGGDRIDNGSLSELSSSESCNSDDDEDECVLIDALATAISHVRISEPKRSRLCSPTGPIVQQGSSNMKANKLCKAF